MSLEAMFCIGLYLAAVNAITFFVYALDKKRARSGEWRIPERQLLFLGLIGGSPGGFAAQRIFRHKTHKEGFQTRFWGCAAVQVILMECLYYAITETG